MSEHLKRQAAAMALATLKPGLRLGLGTGSTARHFVDLLGHQVAQGFDCICVPTSEVTAEQARSLDIPLSDLDTLDRLDVTVDGADEIDPQLNLIKGGGGALLREKIVAAASKRMIVIADASKRVETLGAFPLPIEINGFGMMATFLAIRREATRLGLEGEITLRHSNDQPFITDGGHLILDASFGRIPDPEALSSALHAVPGVVEHGLFLGLATVAILAGESGIEMVSADGSR